MSLLQKTSNEFNDAAAVAIFDQHFKDVPSMNTDYDDRMKRLMFEDIHYNLEYLQIAMRFEDDQVFIEYAR